MTLAQLELTDSSHFVAMEYYGLILNRTFLVVLVDKTLIALKGNGLVGVEAGRDILTRTITAATAVRGDLTNPHSYLKEKYIRKVENEDLMGDQILAADTANFRVSKGDIVDVKYDPRKKFGMGPYPHDGRVTIKLANGKSREFIILGNQSGEKIKQSILAL